MVKTTSGGYANFTLAALEDALRNSFEKEQAAKQAKAQAAKEAIQQACAEKDKAFDTAHQQDEARRRAALGLGKPRTVLPASRIINDAPTFKNNDGTDYSFGR